MNKADLIKNLNFIYNNIENALSDESVMTVGKRINNINDDLGGLIQELEDEKEEEIDKEEFGNKE